jgi:hypothetical protein
MTQQAGIGLAYELHWTEKIKGQPNKYRFIDLDPLCCFPVYDYSISAKLIAFIYTSSTGEDSEKAVTVYYDGYIDEYTSKDGKLIPGVMGKYNEYQEIPVVVYYNSHKRGEINSVCQKVKPYIDAMDCVLKGNWDEIDKGMRALLLHMTEISQKDKDDMVNHKDWQLDNIEEIGAIKYLAKEIQVEYQRFFYDIIRGEIHKNAHIVDWYNPDSGMGNVESGKALTYRLTDMNGLAKRVECFNREGQYKRIRLLQNVEALPAGEANMIEVVYNHNIPEDKFEILTALNQDTILSKRTKYEMIPGVDADTEQERKKLEDEESLDGMYEDAKKKTNPIIDEEEIDQEANLENGN